MAKTLAQLQKQIARLEQQADQIKKKEMAGVIARIKEAIAFYELTPADLGFGRAGKGGPAASKPRRGAARKSARKTVGKIKYRDDQGNTWTGHGRRPGWFVAALAAGKTAADLAA